MSRHDLKKCFIFTCYSTSSPQGLLVIEVLDLSDGNDENHRDEPARYQVKF